MLQSGKKDIQQELLSFKPITESHRRKS